MSSPVAAVARGFTGAQSGMGWGVTIERDLVIDILRARGQGNKAVQAAEQLPAHIDPDQYVLELGQLGLHALA